MSTQTGAPAGAAELCFTCPLDLIEMYAKAPETAHIRSRGYLDTPKPPGTCWRVWKGLSRGALVVLCGLSFGCGVKWHSGMSAQNARDIEQVQQTFDQWGPRIDAATRLVSELKGWSWVLILGIPFACYIGPKIMWLLVQRAIRKKP